MKNIFLAIVLSSASLFVSAGSGSGIIPYWKKFRSTTDISNFTHVSNISDAVVTVRIKLYDASGNFYSEATETGTNITVHGSFSGDPMSAAGATLNANEHGYVRVYLGTTFEGYGIITWESSGDESVAIMAHNMVVQSNLTSSDPKLDKMVFPVNDHRPF